jgi:hypothetical protein
MPGNLTLWLASLLAMVGIAGGSYFEGRMDGKTVVQAQWNAEKAEQQKKLAETAAAYRDREQQLAQTVNDITQEKNRAVNDLEQRVAVLSDRVRQFAERPDLPPTPKTATHGQCRPVACGPVIYRPDAEFLGKEAERADKLRLSLLACQRQYEAAANAQTE